MKLSALGHGSTRFAAEHADVEVSSIVYDSRHATAGSVFVALKGLQADGVSFAKDAIRRVDERARGRRAYAAAAARSAQARSSASSRTAGGWAPETP